MVLSLKSCVEITLTGVISIVLIRYFFSMNWYKYVGILMDTDVSLIFISNEKKIFLNNIF